MSRDLIVEMTPFGARTALMRDGELLEMRFADSDVSDMRGRVYLARVKSLDGKLDAAFVDCGGDQIAYLSGRDGRFVTGKRSELPISRQVKSRSFVRASPSSGTSRANVPVDRQLPSVRAIGKPKVMSEVASRRSQQAAMTAPPPVQAPEIAAMVGTGQASTAPSDLSTRTS